MPAKNKTLVKLSYSVLNAWSRGNWEDAVAMYLGKSIPSTPALELGRAKDELWTAYAINHNKLHDELGGDKLKSPVLQQKYERIIPFSDDMDILLRGRPDMVDGDRIEDFKCGMTTASQYVDSFQLDYYKLLVPEATEGIYRCYNPYEDKLTLGIKYLTDKSVERALEHLMTFAGEIINYLSYEKKLYDYSKRMT